MPNYGNKHSGGGVKVSRKQEGVRVKTPTKGHCYPRRSK